MDSRWYKVWPTWGPKSLDIDRPVSEYIRVWAKLTPNRIALSFYGRDITYSDFNLIVDTLTRRLHDLGVNKGDRVAIHMENCPQFVIAYFSILRAGGIIVPANPMYKGAELDHELNDAGVETLIGMDVFYPTVEKIKKHTKLKEVEDMLFRHPSIKETAVIGVPDEYRGESPKAFVVLHEDYAGTITEQEILDWCKDNMAAYKRPRMIEFKTELPKSNAGKLLRRLLVAEEQGK